MVFFFLTSSTFPVIMSLMSSSPPARAAPAALALFRKTTFGKMFREYYRNSLVRLLLPVDKGAHVLCGGVYPKRVDDGDHLAEVLHVLFFLHGL